jgi:hypothetical protein
MLLHEENVAMTVETKTDPSRIATAEWPSNNRRRGDDGCWGTNREPRPEANEELVFPTVSPPPISWPRVFPGI